MNEEKWNPIAGFEGRYEVSNIGRIRAVFFTKRNHAPPPRYLKTRTNPDGYPQLSIIRADGKKMYFKVGVLVARGFVHNPKPEEYDEVNHIDGNKSNSNDWNLEWTDHQGNEDHASRTGLKRSGERCSWSKLTEEQVIDILTNYPDTDQRATAKTFNVSQNTIWCIKSGLTWASPFSFRRTGFKRPVSQPSV